MNEFLEDLVNLWRDEPLHLTATLLAGVVLGVIATSVA